MAPRPAPLQRYATAAIHPSDSSEKTALKSRSRSVMSAKARSVSIEPPPRPGLQRQATTAVHKIHEAQTSAAGTAVTESRYSKHARNLSLQNRKPSTRRSLKKLSSFRLSDAAGRRVSDGMDADDAEWLQSMMPDDMTLSATRFSDDSFLTELFTADELKWVVLPFSRARTAWDLFTLALVLYTAIVLPFQVIFSENELAAEFGGGWLGAMHVLDVCMDVIFLLDIALNFNTAYVQHAILHTRKPDIARHYASRWLWVDAVGSIPWELIEMVAEAASGSDVATADVVGAFKVLKVPKLLRMGRLFKFLERFEGAANIGRIAVRIFMLVILVHWLAAIWYSVAGAWRGAARAEMGVPVSELDLVSQYVFTYYATLLMVMGDDINPTTRDETIYVTLVVLVGSCVNASIFAAVANLVAQMSASSALHQRKMDGVAAAMRILKVNDATARRIRAYFEYTWTRHRDHAGDLFIGSLPYQLRSRVSCLVHEPRIRQCPIFANLDRKLVAALSISLSPEVYLPGEFILVAGYVSRCMYFVARGRVQVIRKREHVGAASSAADSHKVVYEERRDYLDELGLFTDSRPALSARSLTHTDLYKLTRADFERAISEYPAPALEMADAVHSMLQPSVAKLISKRIYEVLQREGPPTIIRRVSQLRSSRRSSTGVGEEAAGRATGVRRRETVTLSAGAAAAAADGPPSPGSPGSEIMDTRAAHGPPGANGEWSAESTGAAESPRLEELEALERMLADDDGGGGGKKRGSTVARAAAGAAVVLGGGDGGGAATLEQLQAQQLALFALQKEMATQLDAVAAALGIGEGGGDAEGGDGDGDGAVADPPKREKRLSEAGEVLSDALAPLGSQLDGVVAPRMTGGGIF